MKEHISQPKFACQLEDTRNAHAVDIKREKEHNALSHATSQSMKSEDDSDDSKLERSTAWDELFNCQESTPERYCCQYCDFTTNHLILLRHHTNNIHIYLYTTIKESYFEVKNYICRKCDFTTDSVLVSLKHAVEFCKTNILKLKKCPHCPFETHTNAYLKNHVLCWHTDPERIEWFNCNQCGYKAKLKKHLTVHIKTKHTFENLHECCQCFYKTPYRHSLKVHLILKHTVPEEVKWYECDYCDYRSRIKSNLKTHFNSWHVNGKIKWFKCDQCSYKVKSKTFFENHVNAQHTELDKIECYKCHKCHYEAKTKANFQNHKHTREDRMLRCTQCSFKTFHKKHLDSHVTSHVDSEKIKASIRDNLLKYIKLQL